MFLDGLDGSITNIILPIISETFETDIGTVSWMIITYLLMVAGLIIIFGKSAERGLLKRIFLGGLFIFIIGSAACGFSPDFELLLGSRLFQGIGAAMIAATAPLLCITYLPKNMLGMSFGAISMAVSLGVASGPAIGGFLAQYLSWHWAFFINIPIGFLILLFALYVIPNDIPRINPRFDLFGAVLLFGMIASGVYVLERIPHLGITDPQLLLIGVLCIICMILFIVRELICHVPLINIHIFTVWEFTATLFAFFLMCCVYMGIMYLMPFFLHAGMHKDSAVSGLYLLIPPVITVIIGIHLGRWSDRIGRRPFAVAAAFVLILITGIYLQILPETGYIPLFAGLLLMGVYCGLSGGPVASRVVDFVPRGEEGTGSSLMVTSIYLGSVIGTALFAMIFTITTSQDGIVPFSDLTRSTFMHGFHFSMITGLFLSIIVLILSVAVHHKKGSAGNGGGFF